MLCPWCPRHSRIQPRHSRTQPRHSRIQPHHSRTQPRHSRIQPHHSRTQPRHSRVGENLPSIAFDKTELPYYLEPKDDPSKPQPKEPSCNPQSAIINRQSPQPAVYEIRHNPTESDKIRRKLVRARSLIHARERGEVMEKRDSRLRGNDVGGCGNGRGEGVGMTGV